MSPKLLEQLYQQIKRVTNVKIGLADRTGKFYPKVNDLNRKTKTYFEQAIRPDQEAFEISGHAGLIALPIFQNQRLFVVIVAQLSLNEKQTIDVITSMAELIVSQYIYQNKPRPDSVDLLLTRIAYKPTSLDSEELENQLTALGYQSDSPRVAVAFELAGYWDNYLHAVGTPLGDKADLISAKKRDLLQSLNSFFSKSQDNLIGYLGQDRFLILKDLRQNDYHHFCQLLTKHFYEISAPLKNTHIKIVTAGIGLPTTSLNGLIRSVGEALQVLTIGLKVVGGNRAHQFESLGALPLVLSGPKESKINFSRELLAPLDDDEELLDTLEAFLTNDLNLTKTADYLKIHRNTVIYRLNRISESLGRDPRHFNQAVEINLALLYRKYYN